MKRTGLLFSLLLITVLSSAQTRTLIQDLERDVQGKGQIRINRDVRLDSLIGYVSDVQSGAFIKATGYRYIRETTPEPQGTRPMRLPDISATSIPTSRFTPISDRRADYVSWVIFSRLKRLMRLCV